ncbi:hypothetical protein FRC04_007563 [Tulasnella sp. 424]|nr:hypothetical protein FRC04_007563 [Tulasnella sp. 424]KAG8978998.1 hypothetical protein FRC05_009208 [Tulasnella sp. 425]
MQTFMRRKSSAVSLFSTHDDSERGVITIGMDFSLMSISNPKRPIGTSPIKRRPESPVHLKTVDEDSDVDLNDYPITLDSFIPLAPPVQPLRKKRSIGFFKRLRSGSTSSTASSSNIAPSPLSTSPTSSFSTSSSKSTISSSDEEAEPRSPLPETTSFDAPEIVVDEASRLSSESAAKRLRRRGHVRRVSSESRRASGRRASDASTQGRPSLEIITCSSASSSASSAPPPTPRIQISHPFQADYDEPTDPIVADPSDDSFLCLSPTESAEAQATYTYETYEDSRGQWEHPWKRSSSMLPIDWSAIEDQLGCAILPAH